MAILLALCNVVLNSYSTPNLDNMSPYDLVFGHKATISHRLEIRPEVVVSRTFTDYYKRLKKNLKYMRDRLQKFRGERTDFLNKNKEYHAYEVGQIVHMYQAKGSIVQTGSQKKSLLFCGTFSNLQSHRGKSVSIDVIDRTNISTSD